MTVERGTVNVGKRMTGGSFTRGGSTIVAHGKTKVERRSKLARYGGNGVKHGSRKALEEFHKFELPVGIKNFGRDAKFGMAMGRDQRPGMLVPTAGKLTSGAKAGKLLGAATATPLRTAGTIGGTAVGAGALASMKQNQNVNKGPVWTPTPVAMNAQPIGPVKPLSTAPVSTAAGGQVKQGALIPSSKPAQANVAGRAAGGQKSGSIRANGKMGAAATMGSVGSVAAAQPVKKDDPPGTLRIRSHGPTHRRYDPESRRQRRLGQAQAATAAGGALLAGHGVHELRNLNTRAKVVNGLERVGEGGHKASIEPGARAVNRKGAALIGAGALGLAASNRVRRYANDPHNREYS